MEKTKEIAEKARASFDTFVDTVKLRTHLASMDSKETVEKLEQQFEHIRHDFHQFVEHMKTEKDEARVQAHLALMDAKTRFDALGKEIDHVVTSITNNAEETLDHARVQLALGKLEAKEAMHVDDVKKKLEELGGDFKDEWYSLLSKIDERLVDFINRFPLK